MANDGVAVMLTSGASGRINALFSLRVWRSLWLLINAFFLIFVLPFRGRRKCMAAPESAEKAGGGKEEKPPASPGKVVRVPVGMVPRKSAEDKEVAARRATAIKRVVEESGGGDCLREFSLFVSSRGDTIFTQSWTPVKIQVRKLSEVVGHRLRLLRTRLVLGRYDFVTSPVCALDRKPTRWVKVEGVVVVLHGLNEHSGRYNDFAKKLNANGLKVYGMDWIGHGGSDGLHAYVPSLDYAVNDMKVFLSKVLAENPKLPCFCFGHSTGGAIILKAVLDPKVEQRVAGVVLTSPAVGVQPSHQIFTVLAPVFAFLLPRFQLSAANKEGIAVSRDPDALLAKYSDPLVFTGSIRVRTGYEILRITAFLQQNLNRLTVPFLVLHGTDDSVTDPEASRKLHREASSADKTIELYKGCLHDLLFEPEKEEVANNIIAWLNARL